MKETQNIIVDLDGTLALERHRRIKILESWEEYFSLIHLDPVNQSVLEYLRQIDTSHDIFIFTSRPVRYKAATEIWLDNMAVPYDFLEMRSEADTHLGDGEWQSLRSDEAIKTDMLNRYNLKPENTMCVLEDRDEMVAFYRALRFDCWQVHPQHELYKPNSQ